MTGTMRSSEGLDPRRRKLLFRCWHRGTREMDLVLGPFADTCVADLPESDLDDFERLMDVPDHELYGWIVGEIAPPADYATALMQRLRTFHRRAGRQ